MPTRVVYTEEKMAGQVKDFHAPPARVAEAVRQALKKLGFTLTINTDERLAATTSTSLLSWGEKIEVTVSNHNGVTRVNATSEAPYQLFDWGKSDENITKLFSFIEQMLLRKS